MREKHFGVAEGIVRYERLAEDAERLSEEHAPKCPAGDEGCGVCYSLGMLVYHLNNKLEYYQLVGEE